MLREDKVKATSHVISGKCAEKLKRGMIVAIGNYDGKDSYILSAPTDITADNMVMVANDPVNYDERLTEADYEVAAGKQVKGSVHEYMDQLTLTDDMIEGTTVVGKFVEAQAKTKLKATATPTANNKLVYKVIGKTALNGVAATTFIKINN